MGKREREHNPGRRNNVGEGPESCNNTTDLWAQSKHTGGARNVGSSQIRAFYAMHRRSPIPPEAGHSIF